MSSHQYYEISGVEFEKDKELSFVGLGPKNYDPNKRLWEEVCLNLTFHPEIDASQIEVFVHDKVATLKGWVPTRRMKKMAYRCANHIEGLKKVINEINVPPYYMDFISDEYDTY
jgi:osmotically-inducible protein OsmY